MEVRNKLDDDIDFLVSQINSYELTVEEVANRAALVKTLNLDEETLVADLRYDQIKSYKKSYNKKIADFHFESNYAHPEWKMMAAGYHRYPEKCYFRASFIRWYVLKILRRTDNNYSLDKSKRITKPAECTTTLKNLLGAEAFAWYKMALEEELHSWEFLRAVFGKSIRKLSRGAWERKTVMLITGPSGSGKSRTAEYALDELAILLGNRNVSTNRDFGIIVDGGIPRALAHIPALVLKIAYKKGFTAISDLYDYGDFESVKNSIKNCALKDHFPFNVIIPETFSKSCIRVFNDLLDEVSKLPNVNVVLCELDNVDPKVVATLSEFRAFKTKWPEKEVIDYSLNHKDDLKESKIPGGALSFTFGKWGSEKAVKFFKQKFPNNICITVINDLITIQQENETLVVCKRIWEKFEVEKKLPGNENLLLKEFIKQPENTGLAPLMFTNSSMKVLAVQEELKKYEKKLNKLDDKQADELAHIVSVIQLIEDNKTKLHHPDCIEQLFNLIDIVDKLKNKQEYSDAYKKLLSKLSEALIVIRYEITTLIINKTEPSNIIKAFTDSATSSLWRRSITIDQKRMHSSSSTDSEEEMPSIQPASPQSNTHT